MSTVTIIPRSLPKPAGFTPSHHVGIPPTSFKNPWPSAGNKPQSLAQIFKIRFFNSKNKNHVPVPADRNGLPKIITPDWGLGDKPASSRSSIKATWIGHASFLVEMPSTPPGHSHSSPRRSPSTDRTDNDNSGDDDDGGEKPDRQHRGIRILFDPVFSSCMSPFSFGGPKRISLPPCPIEDLPEVDLVLISHDHYDHLDVTTIKFINERAGGRVRYMCGLGVGKHLVGMGVEASHVTECDWWEGSLVEVSGLGTVSVVCTPSQHISGRWWNDHGSTLWCSWVVQEGDVSSSSLPSPSPSSPSSTSSSQTASTSNQRKKKKTLFFAGDTGYRAVSPSTPASPETPSALPSCPAFAQIGTHYGPFDLSLLPIGCYAPREFMSRNHCSPEDAICIHADVKSLKSVGMHYGTVRGNISEFYEDAAEPARLWRRACEERGLKWGEEVLVCDIGETVLG